MKISKIAGGPKQGDILCSLSDIEDGKALSFTYRSGDAVREIFIHRMGDEIFSYENSCPHAFIPLNMNEGIFTEHTGAYFMCHNHGALFDITTGQCFRGPCKERYLTKIEVDLIEGNIIAC